MWATTTSIKIYLMNLFFIKFLSRDNTHFLLMTDISLCDSHQHYLRVSFTAVNDVTSCCVSHDCECGWKSTSGWCVSSQVSDKVNNLKKNLRKNEIFVNFQRVNYLPVNNCKKLIHVTISSCWHDVWVCQFICSCIRVNILEQN